MLAGLYEKYRVTPGDKQGLASALMRAKAHAGGSLQHAFPGATARPIAQRDVLEDERVFISTLSSAGEQGGPLGAYQDIKRDADAARSASVKRRALEAAIARGTEQYRSGDYAGAEKSMMSAHRMVPNYAFLHNASKAKSMAKSSAIDAAQSRGTEQYRSGNYEDAAKSMLSAYSMDPNYSYLLNAGKARLQAGDISGARELYIKAAMTPGAPPEVGKEVATMLQKVDAAMAKSASQPAQPAARMPSATGARVTPLQASTSGAPMRSAPAPAPAAPAAPASQVGVGQMDRQLLTDPTNRAFVRTVLAEMKARGQEEDLGYAMDQLRLEIAKRGTKAPTMIDESVREVLTMDPSQASSGMDMMGMYALADQSTVADWPKIEPIARRVIAARPRGFLELIGMEDELLKVYNRLGKPGGTPGVEFDLKGISERGLKGAQALKARGRRRKDGKPSKYSRSGLDRYLTNRDDRTMVDGKIVPVTVSETNARYEKLMEEIGSGRFKGKKLDEMERLRDKILERRSQKNNEFKIKEARTLDEKTRSKELVAKLEGDLIAARLKKSALINEIKNSPAPYSPQEISSGDSKEKRTAMRTENSRRKTALGKLKKELRNATATEASLARQVKKDAPTQDAEEK